MRQALLLSPIVAVVLWGLLHTPAPLYDQSCLSNSAGLVICAASDMTRITRDGASVNHHPRFNLNNAGALHWQVARNETIAFQLIVRKADNNAPAAVSVTADASALHTQVFAAHYLEVDNAGYQWGPSTQVLPFPASYPDALIPKMQHCGQVQTPVFEQVALPSAGENQSIWIDLYVPDTLTPGLYQQTLRVAGSGEAAEETELTVSLDVIDATLPHSPSIDAVGEVYRAYTLEGAGADRSQPEWQNMAQCYQQLAHRHRMVFIERTPVTPDSPEQWKDYIDTFGPALTGELFSPANGYYGTGQNTPIQIWRTPWPQSYDVTVDAALSDREVSRFTELASDWQRIVQDNDWRETHYFAYVFDEVDGPSTLSEKTPQRERYIARVHSDMQRIQTAIDEGKPPQVTAAAPIDLIWTSHSDPATWTDNPRTTLVDRVRFWAPNAHAANPEFLAERALAGETTWFYHSGHPAVGGHSINLPGTDMRSWGVIGARYGIDGQLMWAVNLGNDDQPFADPSYKPSDDRVGNGVMVYPGNQLARIGYPAAPGPIPSMRLKAWRRGLQDAELYFLAREQFPLEAEALVENLIPRALREAVIAGDTSPTWPEDEALWIHWRDELLALLSR